jgi:hypothetical protein
MDAASMPENVAWYQKLNVAPEPAPSDVPSLAPANPQQQPSPSATGGTDNKFAAASDRVLARE